MRFSAIAACLAALGCVFLVEVARAQPSSSGVPAPEAEVPPVGSQAARAIARPLAAEGARLYDAGQYADAIDRFQKADALYPTPQYRVYIARSCARLGRVTESARTYEKAIALPVPVDAPASFGTAQSTAAAELQEVRRRVATLQVVLTGPLMGEVHVTIDGVAVDGAELPKKELDPGLHTIVAAAEGFDVLTRTIEVREGDAERVELTLQRAAPSTSPGAVIPPGLLSAAGPRPQSDSPSLPDQNGGVSLSHRGQLGALARADIDPVHGGMVIVAGASYGIIDRLEIAAAALVGRDMGVESGLTLFVLTGAWKPFVNAGAPIFFMDGAHVGVRGAAGLQWDPLHNFGVFLQVGGAYFGSAPESYAKAIFMPSAGVQARL